MVRLTDTSANGLAEIAAAVGQKATLAPPRITEEFDVPQYDKYKVTLWINYPRGVKTAIQDAARKIGELMEQAQKLGPDADASELQQRAEALKAEVQGRMSAIVVAHNGWPDEDGNVLPQPPDPAFWDGMDQHLSNIVSQMALEAPGSLPNLASSMRRR